MAFPAFAAGERVGRVPVREDLVCFPWFPPAADALPFAVHEDVDPLRCGRPAPHDLPRLSGAQSVTFCDQVHHAGGTPAFEVRVLLDPAVRSLQQVRSLASLTYPGLAGGGHRKPLQQQLCFRWNAQDAGRRHGFWHTIAPINHVPVPGILSGQSIHVCGIPPAIASGSGV